MKTLAAVLRAKGGPMRVESVELEGPREHEVLVRMKAAGVCRSDWHLVTGDTLHALPVVLGHEGAGMVEDIGPGVKRVRPGDHVSLSWAASCGQCFYCEKERPALCEATKAALWAGTLLDGTTRWSKKGVPLHHYCGLSCFADHIVVPESSCIPIPSKVPFQVAALVGCAVATGMGAVLKTAAMEPGETVAIFGAGGVGLSALLAAKLGGAARCIVADTVETKLAKALELGATCALAAGDDLVARIRSATQGRGADIVIEATGLPAVQEEALNAVRPGGRLVLVGLAPMGTTVNLPSSKVVRQEKAILGSYYGSVVPERDFPLYLARFLEGRLPLDRLVSTTYPLTGIVQAYDDLLAGKVTRGVFVW